MMRRVKSIVSVLAFSAMTLSLTGCDELFGQESNPTPAYLSYDDKSVTIKVGGTFTRKATAAGSAVIEYASSNPSVATVDNEGTVTALAEGEAIITATATGYDSRGKKIYQSKALSYSITVIPASIAATSLTLDKEELLLSLEGASYTTLTATVDDAATDKTVQWESSNTSVASVDASGKVTPVASGTAVITAKAGSISKECKVTVYDQIVNIYTRDVTAKAGKLCFVQGDINQTTSDRRITIEDGGTLILSNVKTKNYTTTSNGITCLGDATIILADGTTNEFENTGGIAIKAGPAGKTLTIKGQSAGTGKIKAKSSDGNAGIGSKKHESCGNILIESGIIEAIGGEGAAGIGTGRADNVTSSCGNIEIKGGQVKATGVSTGAGIGTGLAGSKTNNNGTATCGNITISSGKVEAIGGTCAANIGAGKADAAANSSNSIKTKCGIITISGGEVKAEGTQYGAGIGAGQAFAATSECEAIVISGGTITAVSNGNGNGAGAGIGAGSCGTNTTNNGISKCGSISISGGDITATGISGGAGIGTGQAWSASSTTALISQCGDITITGGKIVAEGSDGAGIGTGRAKLANTVCGNISISGGDITAKGKSGGAGIGTGNIGVTGYIGHTTCGSITITTGITSVKAVKGEDAPNYIGTGKYGTGNPTCGTISYTGLTITGSTTTNTNDTWTLKP